MVDERVCRLAQILTNYSVKVGRGDRVLIVTDVEAKDLALEVYKLSLLAGAHPTVKVELPGRTYTFFKYASEEQIKYFPEVEYFEVKNVDVYIMIRAPQNLKELKSIDPGKISERMKVLKPINDWRVERTRWMIFYHPTNALAQEAGMPLEEFEDFVFNSCLIDWSKQTIEMSRVKEKLENTDTVRIESSDTCLEFSVKGRKAMLGDGTRNMPDGEVFTSVVEDSVNGEIYFDIPAVYVGNEVEGIKLRFKKGEVVEADAKENREFLVSMINTDSGSKRAGEFGIGLNYNITKPIKNILFDEKIGGTVHLALGEGYKETLSQNSSAIHWDLIKDLRKDGRIYFDDQLVMERGRWLI